MKTLYNAMHDRLNPSESAIKRIQVAAVQKQPQKNSKSLRYVLTMAMSLITVFSVAFTVSAEFRESVLGIFRATSITQIEKGFDRESYLVFDETLEGAQTFNIGWSGVVYKLNSNDLTFDSYYKYENGAIIEIVADEKQAEDIRKNEEAALEEYNVFNTEKGIPDDYPDEMYCGDLSPNREWLVYYESYDDVIDKIAYLYNFKSGERISINETLLEGNPLWEFGWLDNNVLAVIAEDPNYVNQSPEGVTNLGRHLYVFKIDEGFLKSNG